MLFYFSSLTGNLILGLENATENTAQGQPPLDNSTPGSNALADGGLMANPMVLIGGGLAVVSAIGLMFTPKPKPVEVEEGQKKPDISYHQVVKLPRYTV